MITKVSSPKSKFSRLQADSRTGDSNLGGRFKLPAEFDSGMFASSFVEEGTEVHAATQRQAVVGTAFTAEGWTVWTYPEQIDTGKVDPKGQPVLAKHPNGGQPHKVTSSGKGGGTYVLMFRDMEVQEQVNEAYGQLSRDRMDQEVRGESLSTRNSDDPGMLTEAKLAQKIGREKSSDEDSHDEIGRTTTVVPKLGSAEHIKKKSKKIGRS